MKDSRERANVAWARLRQAQIDPRLPLAAWLGIEMAIHEDPQAVTKAEFKQVQAAKLVHRMASGTHKRWASERPNPAEPFIKQEVVQELHWYPPSRGRVLRHIGQDLEGAAEHLVDHHLDALLTFKSERAAQGKLGKRPHPHLRSGVRKRTREE